MCVWFSFAAQTQCDCVYCARAWAQFGYAVEVISSFGSHIRGVRVRCAMCASLVAYRPFWPSTVYNAVQAWFLAIDVWEKHRTENSAAQYAINKKFMHKMVVKFSASIFCVLCSLMHTKNDSWFLFHQLCLLLLRSIRSKYESFDLCLWCEICIKFT